MTDHLAEIRVLGDKVVTAYAMNNFEPFFDMSDDLNCIASKTGYFIKLNDAWEKMLGWTKNELMAKPWLEFVHPDDREKTIAAAQEMEKDKLYGFVNRYLCKDGSYVTLEWKTLIWNSSGLTFCIAKLRT